MTHSRILNANQAILLIVDMQEAFRPHLQDIGNLIASICTLVEGSKILEVPVFVTEQYPKGLGRTLTEITACLPEHQYFAKNTFSCCQGKDFMAALMSTGRKQIMVTGIEAHVCVNQTVHDLLQSGYSPHLIAEAISSRKPANKEIGMDKMAGSGAVISSVETALFEMLAEAGTEKFKSIQQLVK